MAVRDSASARLSTAIAKKTFNKISGIQLRFLRTLRCMHNLIKRNLTEKYNT
jgi:hypothetical protein